jgi:hypothetical protein
MVPLAPLVFLSLAACSGASPGEETSETSSAALAVAIDRNPIPSPIMTVGHPITIPPIGLGTIRLACNIPIDSVPSNTVIDSAFPGVTFTAVQLPTSGGGGWSPIPNAHVYAVAVPYPPAGAPAQNGISLNTSQYGVYPGLFSASDGAIEITFATPVSSFTASAEWIYNYGQNETPLGSANLPFVSSWGGPNDSFIGTVTYAFGDGGVSGINDWFAETASGNQITTVILGTGSKYTNGIANVIFSDLQCAY